MNNNRPFISIVIPTRNRAHLLRHAIQSALSQNFDDYEVLISDNHSQDDTAEVIKEFEPNRIRHVRTDEALSMPDHWEFALGHARGKYINYLCDDDALAPDALQIVSDTIAGNNSRMIVLGTAVYYSASWLDSTVLNCVGLYSYTGKTVEIDAESTYRLFATCQETFKAPRMLNTFVEREGLLKARARAGRIFWLCPDYSFGPIVMTEIPRWTYIDSPIRLQGVFREGIGAALTYDGGEPFREFLSEFKETKLLERVPLKLPLVTSAIAETLLQIKERLPVELAEFQIDWSQYFLNCWTNIWTHEIHGRNTQNDKDEFFRALGEQPEEIRLRVLAAGKPPIVEPRIGKRPLVKRAIRKVINATPLMRSLESAVRPRSTASGRSEVNDDGSRYIRGEDAGFTNILECARNLHRWRFANDEIQNPPKEPADKALMLGLQ